MRAVINQQYGGPEVLGVRDVQRPRARAGEIVVQVVASTVTQGDRRLRAADFPGISALFGRLLFGLRRPRHPVGGTHFAGRVVEVGAGVTAFVPGDDVYGGVMAGAYAERLSLPAKAAVARMPSSLSYAEAAALPYGAVTALVFLRDLAKLREGERVLVVGAAGGVGRMAVQIAKSLGGHVTAACGEGAELVRSLGADDVIDYRTRCVAASGQRWDVVLDTTQGDHYRLYSPALREGGRYLSLYMTPRLLLQMATTALVGSKRALTGVAMASPQLLDDVSALVEKHALRDVIAARYSMQDIAAAHTLLEKERPHGSIVIDIAERLEHEAPGSDEKPAAPGDAGHRKAS